MLSETDELVPKRTRRPFWAWKELLARYNPDTNSSMWVFPQEAAAFGPWPSFASSCLTAPYLLYDLLTCHLVLQSVVNVPALCI